MVSKVLDKLGWRVRGHHYHLQLVEWYGEVFQHAQYLQLSFVLTFGIRIVAYLEGPLPPDYPVHAARLHFPSVALLGGSLFPCDLGGFVAR